MVVGSVSCCSESSAPTGDRVVVYVKDISYHAGESVIDIAMWSDGRVVWFDDDRYLVGRVSQSEVERHLEEVRAIASPMVSGAAFTAPDAHYWEVGIRSGDGTMQVYIWNEDNSYLPDEVRSDGRFVNAWIATKRFLHLILPRPDSRLIESQVDSNAFRAAFPGYLPAS